MTTRYEIIMYWSDEDQSFIAEAPKLLGCMADGSTRQQTIEKIEQIMDEWIETATSLGRTIPEPKGRLLYA